MRGIAVSFLMDLVAAISAPTTRIGDGRVELQEAA
jgi:hypothetical protein